MRQTITIILLSLICVGASAQTDSAVSRPKRYNISREIKPPILNILDNSVRFIDSNGNNAIDANEECFIRLRVSNTGVGDAVGCTAEITAEGDSDGLRYSKGKNLPVLEVGESYTIEMEVESGQGTKDGAVDFSVWVEEPNGFGTDVQHIVVNTRAFAAPFIQVTDFTVTGGAATLVKKQPFDLQVTVQNTRVGIAEDVEVSLELPNNIVSLDGSTEHRFSRMAPGDTRSLIFSLIANNRYQGETIPVKVHVSEKYGKYAEDKLITLNINQAMSGRKIIVSAEEEDQPAEISIASLRSDVDRNIPHTSSDNDNTFVVIVANENYRREAKVDFALNDGRIFRQYCNMTLGIPESNITYYPDATLNDIRAGVNWLAQVSRAYSGDARIIFYYAGHGIPDESDGSSYLLPADGFAADVNSGYRLSTLYSQLSDMPSRSAVVFMDACFSGAKRDGGILASARGVAIKAKKETPSNGMVVFSAAQSDETAYPYAEQSHGMFTYFLLKKLQESNGESTLGELADFIGENVSRRSIVSNRKSQTPTVIPSADFADTWEKMKLK